MSAGYGQARTRAAPAHTLGVKVLLNWWHSNNMSRVCRKADAILMISLATCIAYYGNGENHTFHILRHHGDINREALLAALLLVAVNVGVFLYVQIRVRLMQGVSDDPELVPKWAMHVAGPCAALAVILFIWACWGVFGWLSIPIAYLYLLAFVMSMHFVPNVAGYSSALEKKNDTKAM